MSPTSPNGPDIEYFPPTAPHAESRADTLDRVTGGRPTSPRRGSERPLLAHAIACAIAGAAIGAVVGLILSLEPGPFSTDTIQSTIGLMMVLGAVIALVITLLATLVLMEREDGHPHEAEGRTFTAAGPTPASPRPRPAGRAPGRSRR